MSKLNDQLEDDAAALVDAGVEDGRTRRHDCNTGVPVHDFDIVHEDGLVSALEVTVLVDQEELSTSNAIGKYGGAYYQSDRLTHAWHVQFGPKGKIKKWGPRVEPILVEFEQRGWLAGAWTDEL